MAFRAALGALLLASTLSSAATASAEQPILGAHNTITAARDGTIDVVLPRDVTLPLKQNTRSEAGPAPWISFEGGGRVTGIVLIPRGSDNAISYGLVATQFSSCRRECQERPVNALMVNGAFFHGSETLRSGEYRLYVFTDGGHVTITLDLAELKGDTDLHVEGRAHADIRTPAVGMDPRDDVTAYSARASYEMTEHAGLFMSVNVMRDENYKGGSFDECLSPDHIVPDDLEKIYCFPGGGFTFVHPLDPTEMIQPRKGGFILTTFVGLTDWNDNVFNGDSSLQHYSFRVIAPGSMGELWSQGVLLSL
jgi:hypothetical protein